MPCATLFFPFEACFFRPSPPPNPRPGPRFWPRAMTRSLSFWLLESFPEFFSIRAFRTSLFCACKYGQANIPRDSIFANPLPFPPRSLPSFAISCKATFWESHDRTHSPLSAPPLRLMGDGRHSKTYGQPSGQILQIFKFLPWTSLVRVVVSPGFPRSPDSGPASGNLSESHFFVPKYSFRVGRPPMILPLNDP